MIALKRSHYSYTYDFFHTNWLVLYDALQLILLSVFVGTISFPAQALAFTNDVELAHRTLIFERDPTLEGRAIVGIEAFPSSQTVAGLLKSASLEVRSTLAVGSVVRLLSTAYSSTIDQTDSSPFITASGRRVGPGTIAANFLPFGTQVRVGRQTYTVWDRLNSRYNGKYIIDIWQPSRAAAQNYGARVVEMEVVAMPQVGN